MVVRWLASSVIAGVLLLQGFWVVPASLRNRVFWKLGGRPLIAALKAPISYPFLDYPMYSRSHSAGDPVPQLRLVGVRTDGSEVHLTPESLGMLRWHFAYLLRAIAQGDTERARACLDAFDFDVAQGLASVRLEDQPILWGDGPARLGERSTVATLALRES